MCANYAVGGRGAGAVHVDGAARASESTVTAQQLHAAQKMPSTSVDYRVVTAVVVRREKGHAAHRIRDRARDVPLTAHTIRRAR